MSDEPSKTPRHDALNCGRLQSNWRAWRGLAFDLENRLSEATSRAERAEHDLACMREDMKEMQRDHREELRDAVSEARREERTGDPYGTY